MEYKFLVANHNMTESQKCNWKTQPRNISFFIYWWDWDLHLGLHFAKQALYYLNCTSSSFCCGYFGDGVSPTIYAGWPYFNWGPYFNLPSSYEYRCELPVPDETFISEIWTSINSVTLKSLSTVKLQISQIKLICGAKVYNIGNKLLSVPMNLLSPCFYYLFHFSVSSPCLSIV
jgi:hypothetical protein